MGLGKKFLKTTPAGYAAIKTMEHRAKPQVQEARQAKRDVKERAESEKAAAKQARAVAKQAQDAARGPAVAKFAPGNFGAIRVYRDGTIESRFGGGNIAGATARVDQAGSKRLFQDSRQSYLTIEGPEVGISAKLLSNSGITVGAARKFAVTVNQLARQLAQQSKTVAAAPGPPGVAPPPPGITPAPAPPGVAGAADSSWGDIPEQIRKLAELRDQGILTDQEFEAKKSELLDRL